MTLLFQTNNIIPYSSFLWAGIVAFFLVAALLNNQLKSNKK